jgi:hypothetical protein
VNGRGQYGIGNSEPSRSSGTDKVVALVVLGTALAIIVPATRHAMKNVKRKAMP